MTPEQETLETIKRMIAELPEDDRIKVQCIVSTLRNVLSAGGAHASTALALVGAELAAQ